MRGGKEAADGEGGGGRRGKGIVTQRDKDVVGDDGGGEWGGAGET